MDSSTKDFLVAEYNTSWQMVLNFDIRRSKFIVFCNVLFISALAFASYQYSTHSRSVAAAFLLSVLFIFVGLAIGTVKKIMESERAANVRYRKKLNLIRENFLSHLDDPKIVHYMARKELGIKDFTNDTDSIDKVGGTLKPIYRMIDIERNASIVFALLIWIEIGYRLLSR